MVKLAVVVNETNLTYFLSDEDPIGALFETIDCLNPDVVLFLYTELSFINRSDFDDARLVLKSMFKHGVVLGGKANKSLHAVVASQIKIAEKNVHDTDTGTVLTLKLDNAKHLEIVTCLVETCEEACTLIKDGTTCLCIAGEELSEELNESLQRAGYVNVASLEGNDVPTPVHFFLKPAPGGCQVSSTHLTSQKVVSIVEFT